MLLQEGEHFFVEEFAVDVFVGDVGALGVEDAEGAAEVPECVADVVLGEECEEVLHPGEGDGVGGVVPRAEFAAEEGGALGLEVEPGVEGGAQLVGAEGGAVGHGLGPGGRDGGAAGPRGEVVGERCGHVAAAAVGDVVGKQLGAGGVTCVEAVDDDGALGGGLADGRDGVGHDAVVIVVGDVGRLVEEVEAEAVSGGVMVALGEGEPVVGERIKGGLIFEQVERLWGEGRVDAVAGGVVEAEAEVEVVLVGVFEGEVDGGEGGEPDVEGAVEGGPAEVAEG